MTYDELCEKHDELCEEYNQTEDEVILEQICAIEIALFGQPLWPADEESNSEDAI